MRRLDGLWRAPVVPLALALSVLVTASAVGAISILVEAESYTDTYDMGGASIMSIACTSASNGLAVDGLDIPGEWIEIKATVPEEACYELVMGFQAVYAETVSTRITVFDDGHSTVEGESSLELVGAGLGWGPFSMAAGSGRVCLKGGTYVLRIELISGSFFLPDYVALNATGTAVTPFEEERSWGAIKSLYR